MTKVRIRLCVDLDRTKTTGILYIHEVNIMYFVHTYRQHCSFTLIFRLLCIYLLLRNCEDNKIGYDENS